MRYLQEWYRGHVVTGVCHIVKGPYTYGTESLPANMVETWCGRAYQDRMGLSPDQETKRYQQAVGLDDCHPANVCHMCQETLQIDTKYPKQLAAMDNDRLYQEFRRRHEPDDYDGDFTTAGWLRLQLAATEMGRRLRECGFLSAPNAN